MNKQVKKLISGGLALGILLTGCGASGGTYATVNGETISQAKYDNQLNVIKSIISAQYQLPANVEKQLIQEMVMRQDLKKNKIEIKDADYKKDYEDAIKAYGGAEGYRRTLETLKIDDKQMKEMLQYETVSRLHKEMYAKQHTPSEDKINKYFEDNKDKLITVKASHILVKTEEEAKKAKERLDKGEKFEDVAKAVSTDSSASAGGSLGEQSPSKFVPAFSNALTNMKEGEISNPVKTEFGYHIIRLEKKNDTPKALHDKIVEALVAQDYALYLQGLVTDAKVEVQGKVKSPGKDAKSGKEQKSDASAKDQSSK